MQVKADRPEAPSGIRSDLGAIFVSLELSRSIWLITSLSPGAGEKMSKHSVPAGDIGAVLARFSEMKQKAFARTGKSFPIIVIQEAGLDGFWIHRVLQKEGIETHQEGRERLIRFPADHFGLAIFGHQWKPARLLMVSRWLARAAHLWPMMSSSSSMVATCLLTMGSSTSAHNVSAGCSSGV